MQELYDIEAIKQLKARYALHTDLYFKDPSNLDRLINEVFSEDIRLDFGAMGLAENREEAEGFFANIVYGALSFCHHLLHNPIITILGSDEAVGNWSFLVPCTFRGEELAGWLSGYYNEKYVKREDKWYIQSIEVDWNFATPFSKGWDVENTFAEDDED